MIRNDTLDVLIESLEIDFPVSMGIDTGFIAVFSTPLIGIEFFLTILMRILFGQPGELLNAVYSEEASLFR